ncbi:MAG TPA: protease complex subunit PrcB family protein [Firmicutes bacterium]|nr:protease complex subunit PrcB family protein [Bacillota bacterium]
MSNTGTPGRRGRFRRGLLLTCLVVAALLFTGLRGEPARATQGLDNVSYRLVQDVPADLASWLDHSKQYPGLFRFSTGDTAYLLISWGEKRTGGYSLTLKGMRTEGEVIVAEVELKAPAPGDPVTQVTTYPHLLVALPATEALFAAEFTGAAWVPVGEGLPPCNPDFFIDAPSPLSEVTSPLRVGGVARVHEGTFRVSIEDGHDVLGSATVRASRGAPGWGAFSTALSFRAPTNPFGHIIFSVQDPRDGRWVEKLGIPVEFGPGQAVDFRDVTGHWAANTIHRAAGRGFLAGYPDGTFRPNANMTRAEFIRAVTGTFHLVTPNPAVTSDPAGTSDPAETSGAVDPKPLRHDGFADMAGHWATAYVDAALAAKVLQKSDYPDGRFQPDHPATRLEMVVQLVRALGKGEEAAQAEYKEAGRGYRDADRIPDQLKGFVGVATGMGIIIGFPDGTFGPERPATRAEATAMIMRALDTREAGQVAAEFFRRWGELDLKGMTALMLVPPEKFIPGSDIVFAPFYPKECPDDVPAFVQASRDLIRQYDAQAWEKVTIEESKANPTAFPASVRIQLRLGQAPYHIWAEMQLTDEGWRVRMLDSLPVKVETPVPPSAFSLDRLQPMDVRDLDGNPGAEVLGWAFWGEYEGMGPEPSGARGFFSFRDGDLKKLWFTKEGPAPGWVWTGEGAMGHLTSPDSLDLLLVRRPANLDGKPQSQEGPLLGLYRLPADTQAPPAGPKPATGAQANATAAQADTTGAIEKVADVPWPQVAPAGTAVYYGLMAARPLDDVPGDEVVISAFCTPPQGSAYQQVLVCRLHGASLQVLGRHQSPPGQSLYLTFAQVTPGGGTQKDPSRSRLYVWTWGGQQFTAVDFGDGKFTPVSLPVPRQTVLAAADIDGEGTDEFLVETARHHLQLVGRDGSVCWETTDYKGIRQAWMGLVKGKLTIVASEPGADAGRVIRWEAREGSTAPSADVNTGRGDGSATLTLERTWSSPPLGRDHLSSLWVLDADGDGELEILVTSSDDFLAPADYLHIFSLASGELENRPAR